MIGVKVALLGIAVIMLGIAIGISGTPEATTPLSLLGILITILGLLGKDTIECKNKQ